MRLIDADALLDEARPAGVLKPSEMMVPLGKLYSAPTIDPARHERWVFEPKTAGYKCSGCGFSANKYQRLLWDYCPKCGAAMWRGEG